MTNTLSKIYAESLSLSDLQIKVMRQVKSQQQSIDRIKEDALISGAMPSDFEIMMRIKRTQFGSQLIPVLV